MPGTIADERSAWPLWLAVGTRVATIHGDMPVEEVQPGMRVLTRAAGLVRVRAVGAATTRNRISPQAAVLLPAGALGAGLPDRDLTVVGDQRVFVFGDLAPDGDGFAAASDVGIAGKAPDTVLLRLDLASDGPVTVLANGAWLGTSAPGGAAVHPGGRQAITA